MTMHGTTRVSTLLNTRRKRREGGMKEWKPKLHSELGDRFMEQYYAKHPTGKKDCA